MGLQIIMGGLSYTAGPGWSSPHDPPGIKQGLG